MSDFVWILDGNKAAYLGNSGVSPSYIVPKNDIVDSERNIAGKRLWFVVRGSEDRLFQAIRVKKVERIIEGYYTGDYLIASEITDSFKLVHSYQQASKYRVTDLSRFSLGIAALPDEISLTLKTMVIGSAQTRLVPPDKRSLTNIALQLAPRNTERLAKSAIRAIVTRLTLDEVWGRVVNLRLGPFANFAYELVTYPTDANLIERLNALDPIVALSSKDISRSENEVIKPTALPKVDSEFTEIEPNNIYAREFISIDAKLKYLEDALNKTEHAEKIHQAMLKDIVEYLISKGITPYESGSIDLAYKTGHQLNVLEIKSANSENVLSQSAKGAFQLACYSHELSKDYVALDAKLIIHETNSSDIQNYAITVLLRLGIGVLVYNPEKSWPDRVKGLTVISNSSDS